MAVIHKNLTGDEAIHPSAYIQTSDPGAVGADKQWVDTTTGTSLASGWILKFRNAGNAAWTTALDLLTALNLKANLASPTFTGTPAAPTATGGTNTTQIATTAFVTAAVTASGGIQETIMDAKGDLIAGTAADTAARLAVGSNGKYLVAASGETTGLKWQFLPGEWERACSDETTALTTGVKLTFRAPYGMVGSEVRANVNTVSSSGAVTIDIKKNGSTIFSTTLTIDVSEKTSVTAATPAVISDTAWTDDAEFTVEITGAGTGAKGLKIVMLGTRTS